MQTKNVSAPRIKLKIILGSTREGRFSEKPAQWIFKEAEKFAGVAAELLDLRDYPMPFFASSLSPSMMHGKYENAVVQKWSAKIAAADAFIIVAPEYNHGYPAVLKNALDVIYPEWNKKPVGFVSYGGVMGARSVEQLRQVAVALQMMPIKNTVHIPNDIFFPAMLGKSTADWQEMFQPMRKTSRKNSVNRFFKELFWWAQALKTARKESP